MYKLLDFSHFLSPTLLKVLNNIMGSFTYLPFDLLIDRVGKQFRARVLSSPAGEGSHLFTLTTIPPYFELQTRRRTQDSLQLFGARLFHIVFGGQVRHLFDLSLSQARSQEKGLRVLLRLAEVPQLASLPWEYLYDARQARFVALSRQSVLTRYLALSERNRSVVTQSPLRILVALASPFDQPPLQVDEEWQGLQSGLSRLVKEGIIEVERLEQATIECLQQQLRQKPYHIFHFVGHGGFDERGQAGFLHFETKNRRSNTISARDLGQLLYDHSSLRLVFLNACQGGRGSVKHSFTSVASVLMQQGIPAVIGMQFEMTDKAAIVFAAEFYRAIADEYPLEVALTEARRAVYYQANQIEWGTAVLHMRAPDGHLFKTAHSYSMPAPLSMPISTTEERYLDAAMPNQVIIGQSTELVALIRLPTSAGLRAYLANAPQIEAQANDVKSSSFSLEFPPDQNGKPTPLELYIDLETDDFEVPSKRKKIQVQAGKDTAVTIFRLTPRKSGPLKLLLQVFLSGETLLASDFVKVKGVSKLNQAVRSTISLISLSLGSFGLTSHAQEERYGFNNEVEEIARHITHGKLLVLVGPALANASILVEFTHILKQHGNQLLTYEKIDELLHADEVKQETISTSLKKIDEQVEVLLLGYETSDTQTKRLLHVIHQEKSNEAYLIHPDLAIESLINILRLLE